MAMTDGTKLGKRQIGKREVTNENPLPKSPAEEVSEHIVVPDVTTEGSLTVMAAIPPYFLEHDGRNLESVTEAESRTYINNDLSMRRFAIGKLGEHNIKSRHKWEYQDFYSMLRKKGIASPGLFFAETLEHDASRLLTRNELTNNAVKADNYQFFLRNASVVKVNIARVMLAKIDVDRDIGKLFSDFFQDKEKWANTDPDIVIAEAENRLRKVRTRHKGEYEMLISLYENIDKMDRQYKYYSKKRTEKMQRALTDAVRSQQKKLLGINRKDDADINYREVVALIEKALEADDGIRDRENMYFVSYIDAKIERQKRADRGSGKVDAGLVHLSDIIGEEDDKGSIYGIGNKTVSEVMKDIEDFKRIEKEFVEMHNNVMSGATEGVKQYLKKTDSYPAAILAVLSKDEGLVDENPENPGEIEDIEKATRAALAVALAKNNKLTGNESEDKKVISEARKNLDDIIQKHKDVFGYIYNPSKNTMNSFHKYSPYTYTSRDPYNDNAMTILRDSIYLAALKASNKEVYQEIYSKENQENLLVSGIDRETEMLKPDMDEANDAFNTYLYLQKSISGRMDSDTAKAILESEAFDGNTLLAGGGRENIQKLGSELSKYAERSNEKNIYPTYDEVALREYVQEMITLKSADKLIGRLSFDNTKRWFFQNNKALYSFFTCIENSKNPATTVETTPSLARGCFDKLQQAFEQDATLAKHLEGKMNSAVLASNPFGFLVYLRIILSGSEQERLERTILQMNEEISDTISYIETAQDRRQAMARMVNLEAESQGMGGSYVAEGFENKAISDIELESVVRDIGKVQDGLPDDLKLMPESAIERFQNGNLPRIREAIIKKTLESLNNNKQRLALLEEKRKEEIASLIEEKREKELLMSKVAKLKESIRRDGEVGDEKKEELTSLAEQLANKLKYTERTIADKEHRLKKLDRILEDIKESDESRTKERFSKEGVIDFRGMMLREKLEMAIILNRYKEELFEEKLLAEGQGKSISGALSREISKIERIIPAIQKEVVGSNAVAADIISGELSDKFNVHISKETKNKIIKNGLQESINDIVEDVLKNNNSIQKEKLREINMVLRRNADALEIIRGHSGSRPFNEQESLVASRYLRKVNKHSDAVSKAIKNNNNMYVVEGVRGNGMVYIFGGQGERGFYAKKLDKYFNEEKYDEAQALMSKVKAYDADLHSEMQEYIASKHEDIKSADADAKKEKRKHKKQSNYRKSKGI